MNSKVDRPLMLAVANQLLGKPVVAVGTVVSVSRSNPYAGSTNPSKQFRILLKNVHVGVAPNMSRSVVVDHLWLGGCQSLIPLRYVPFGTRVRITGKVTPYVYNGIARWTLGFPYSNVEIGKRFLLTNHTNYNHTNHSSNAGQAKNVQWMWQRIHPERDPDGNL